MQEEEIRPQKIFNEYLRLCEIDSLDYFSDVPHVDISCPACENVGKYSFQKSSFVYKLCNKCDTLFISPRPIESAFSRYYIEAPSVKYWATTFYKETVQARRKKIWRPKAKMVLELMNRFNVTSNHIVDIGAGYGVFCEEIKRISNLSVTAIEPGPELAKICRKKGLYVIENFLQNVLIEELKDEPKVFVSFELFEHLHDPKYFLRSLYNLMQVGDIFIFTTLSGTGVDIKALWENSKSIAPPHHLNFFNPFSIQILLKKLGYEILEVSTPGKLDIDILMNNKQLIKDQFWRVFIKYSTEEVRENWQSLISESGWSSHMMVCCQKI